MDCYVGIDIGAVSATATVLACQADAAPRMEGMEPVRGRSGALGLTAYRRTRGKPLEAATKLLDDIIAAVGADNVKAVSLTGTGSELAAEALGAGVVNEFRAIAAGVAELGIDARTVFEMGGETSKYLRIAREDDGSCAILDYSTNGDCAAGTGSFIDQQAGRLKYDVEQIGEICLSADRAAQVAGRCSVFAKSDMIHAQQKGYAPAEVLRGLCDAVARNFRTAVVRSHPVQGPVVFIGGVAANQAVVRAMREAFELDESELVVPEHFAHVPAVGAAVLAMSSAKATDLSNMQRLRKASDAASTDFPRTPPLSTENVVALRDRVEPYEPPADGSKIDAYLGIDIGSVSTNVVIISNEGRLIQEIYTRTQGRPIEVVSDALKQLHERWGGRLKVRGVGTTGSGRELIGALIGADTINDEITAHKTGATFVGQTMLDGRVPDTIFEIGGQDSKYISLQDGVVVDFTMNEACAAGTGSFLEERAEELDIAIKGEFAELALSSRAPVRLGERCTVFMERDVNSYMQRGAEKPDLVAGLAYSVVYNYINRVVRGRPIGDTIYFQGGTAYNDAVAAAFAGVCGKEVIVPPFNGVVGAIGAALLAREKMLMGAGDQAPSELGSYVSELETAEPVASSRFRGYDLERVNYTLREFTCRGCSNNCQIQEFTVEDEKTYWGDKCSDRFRKAVKSKRQAGIEDLLDYRMTRLLDESHQPDIPGEAPLVGIPLTMFAYDSLPFWRTLLAHLGCRTVLSDQTNKKIIQAGLDTVVAEPCFPIIAAHGHMANLEAKGVDFIFLPNVVSQETQHLDNESYLCPWHQTLPFVARQAPALMHLQEKIITPTVYFREGRSLIRKYFQRWLGDTALGRRLDCSKKRIGQAVDAAFAAQDGFESEIRRKGDEVLDTLTKTGETAVVLLGRPYNIHDAGMNLSVGSKLRDYYGVNVVPLDFLNAEDVDHRDVNHNMYWNLGRNILAASKLVGRHDNLHIIYITNFKCGPDSFIKHFVRKASGKPFLTLQFDGHSNDAGMMTRCEAYLDSKGILRPWRKDIQKQAAQAV
jgi:predicted CoA-substrate-specific enzyme activase